MPTEKPQISGLLARLLGASCYMALSQVTCMFKDTVHLSQNDEFYLVTDTEGTTDLELLQKIDTEELDSTIKIQLSMLG
jgi:2-hydroxychromene-2-carboxylate isomerase